VTITAKVLYGVLSLPLAALDVLLDGINEPDPPPNKEDKSVLVWSWVDVCLNGLLQILSLPTDRDWFRNPAETWMDSVWIAGWLPPLATAVLLYPPLEDNVRAQDTGKVGLSIGGAALMGCGIAAAVEGMQANPPIQNGWDIAYAIFSPMGNALQFLRLQSLVDSTDMLSLGAKCAIDVVGDLGAGVTQGPG
jgi:hypothetical protein